MEVRKTPLQHGDGLGGQVCVAVNLAQLAGQTPAGPGSDVTGKSAPHKPRRDNTTGGKPPGLSIIVKIIKNGYSEFKGISGAKSACGNISSQALSACRAGSQLE
jgi:hypothetical protein